MNEKMIAELIELARSSCFHDNEDEYCCVEDYVGNNVDDAFELGDRAGQVMLARNVLDALEIDWCKTA